MGSKREILPTLLVATIAIAVVCGSITALSGLVLIFDPVRLTGTVGGGSEGSYARALGLFFCLCGGSFAAFSFAAGLSARTLRRRALESQRLNASADLPTRPAARS